MITQAETEAKPLAFNLHLFKTVLSLFAMLLLGACSNNKRTVDTDIDPIITEDNRLQVTLRDGSTVDLRIRRGPQEESPRSACDASVYEEIGSLTYVDKIMEDETYTTPAEANARRAELRQHIMARRQALKERFEDEFPSPGGKTITCHLLLQAGDLIHMPLAFKGANSSNLDITCLGEGDNRAQIRNPVDTSVHISHDKDVAMMQFGPANCGIVPLEQGGSSYIDELGGAKTLCDPVRNIRINNCRIRGRVTASSLPGILFDLSNIRTDHVDRLQRSAAQHVTFTDSQIIGRYKGAVHFLPGVHHFTIEDSEVLGGFLGITIHLPADGGWNVIKNNRITGQRKTNSLAWEYKGGKREVISIDSSEHNRIVNNHITDMTYGGIFLYRNCGERGSVRHRIPQYNQIINNVFDHSSDPGTHPTVFVGSRDDLSIKYSFGFGVKRYCHEDEMPGRVRYPTNPVLQPWDTERVRNSSLSNSDWAQNNVIAENQIIRYNPDPRYGGYPKIKLSSKVKKLDNYLINNELVPGRSVQEALGSKTLRGAGCAVLAGITHQMQVPYRSEIKNGHVPYIKHQEVVKYFWDLRPRPELTCGTPLICDDNILTHDRTIACLPPIVYEYGPESAACDASNNVCAEGDNDGDSHTLGCPTGRLLGVQAACNLEFGKATDDQRDQVPINRVKVFRTSDNEGDGRCTVDETKIRQGSKIITPWLFTRYSGEPTPNELFYKCKEHDRNGGDCHINIKHYCEPR